MSELTKLVIKLKATERTIRILDTMNIDWLDCETKQYMIATAEAKRTEYNQKIEKLRTGNKFQQFLNNRDENLLGNYQPEAGVRCQLNNEPHQP